MKQLMMRNHQKIRKQIELREKQKIKKLIRLCCISLVWHVKSAQAEARSHLVCFDGDNLNANSMYTYLMEHFKNGDEMQLANLLLKFGELTMLSGEKLKDFVARFRKVVAEIRAVDKEQVPTKLAQIIKLKDAVKFASESFYNALMVNDQLPLETLIRKIEQFSGPNNIAKMKSDEVSRSEVVNFVQQKQKESAERNSRKFYSKDNPNNSQNSFPPISNRLITLCSEF